MAIKVRVLLSSVVVLSTMWLVSCGHYVCGTTFGNSSCTAPSGGISQGGSGIGTPAAFDFFQDSGSLNAAIVDTSGNFDLIPNFVSPPQTLSGTGGMLIVQKQWLYIALTGGLSIEAYSIDGKTGALTAISGQPFSSPNTNAITADPAGKFLFLCGADNDQVTVFAINQTSGALTQVGSFPVGVGFAEQATTDGLGKYLYVTAGNLGSQVAVFTILPNGSLNPVTGSPFSITIAQLEGEPTGKFLLGVTGNGANNGFTSDDHVYVFSINQSTGVLTPVTGSPFATTFTPGRLAVNPNGTLVYTFNQTVTGTSPMEGFQLNTTTGALTPLASSPFTSITAPAGVFDPSGTYLFMHPSTTLTAASVNTTTGALTSIGQPIPNAGNPVAWAATDPH